MAPVNYWVTTITIWVNAVSYSCYDIMISAIKTTNDSTRHEIYIQTHYAKYFHWPITFIFKTIIQPSFRNESKKHNEFRIK